MEPIRLSYICLLSDDRFSVLESHPPESPSANRTSDIFLSFLSVVSLFPQLCCDSLRLCRVSQAELWPWGMWHRVLLPLSAAVAPQPDVRPGPASASPPHLRRQRCLYTVRLQWRTWRRWDRSHVIKWSYESFVGLFALNNHLKKSAWFCHEYFQACMVFRSVRQIGLLSICLTDKFVIYRLKSCHGYTVISSIISIKFGSASNLR